MARTTFIAAAAGGLVLAIALSANAQQANPAAAPAAPKNTTSTINAARENSTQPPQPQSQQFAQAGDYTQPPAQPVSLGDLARSIRANKKSEVKAVRIVDNDEIPSVGDKGGDSSPSGGVASGAASKGKVVLMDFWATWCGPCRDSLPDLKQLVNSMGSNKLEVISVSEDTNERAWHDFTSANAMNWEQQRDTTHRLMQQYGVSALPTYVLLGDNGAVLQRYVGEDTQNSLADRIGPDIQKALASNR